MFRTHSSPRRPGREAVPVRAPFAGDAGYARHAAGLFPTLPVPHEVQASRDGGDSAQLLLHHSLRVPSGAAAARPDPTSRPAHDSQPHGRCLTCWRPRVQCVENSPARLPQAAPLDLARIVPGRDAAEHGGVHAPQPIQIDVGVPDTPRVGRSARAQRPRTQREREKQRNGREKAISAHTKASQAGDKGPDVCLCMCACMRACHSPLFLLVHCGQKVRMRLCACHSVGSLRAKSVFARAHDRTNDSATTTTGEARSGHD